MVDLLKNELEPIRVSDLPELSRSLKKLTMLQGYYQHMIMEAEGHPSFYVTFKESNRGKGFFFFQEFSTDALQNEVFSLFKNRAIPLKSGFGFKVEMKHVK